MEGFEQDFPGEAMGGITPSGADEEADHPMKKPIGFYFKEQESGAPRVSMPVPMGTMDEALSVGVGACTLAEGPEVM
jgi:hypothetical protein